jgi:hypothetical protein
MAGTPSPFCRRAVDRKSASTLSPGEGGSRGPFSSEPLFGRKLFVDAQAFNTTENARRDPFNRRSATVYSTCESLHRNPAPSIALPPRSYSFAAAD